ncbi:MAG TPA: acyl-CoA dehydrogenase [Alphaproteobacteria bacterium]|nr:acyl-CoA dehydrogenase [Alphaproteobacteria bacterium]
MSFIDPRGLAFLLYDWLGADRLPERPRFAEHSRETFDAILELSAQLATDEFATHSKKSDREEPELIGGQVRVIPEVKRALAAYAEAGLFAASFDHAHGGLQLPHLLLTASWAHFMSANVATAAFPMLAAANARVIVRFGTAAQIAAFALPEIEGRALGTMCLSEPQAGSSLADIKTRAERDGEDASGRRYRLTGNKMWISGGDHDITENIIHLVLAKIPGPDGALISGTAGISLFIVPKILADGERNDVSVAGLNHKMGYRAIPNCLLNLGEGTAYKPQGRAGAIGYLVGEEGQGLAIMFHMMNEARIAIGLGAAALACRGYRQSLDYARERPQGRALGSRDPSAPQVPIIRHPDVRRMLLAEKAYAEGALALVLYAAKLVDDEATHPDAAERARSGALLGLLTPVAKSWPSEFGLAANDLAIQIHGGYGYTRDFDVEQTYRDNRLNPIHEGTHGIQAIDLVGRKILRDKGAGLVLLGEEIAKTAASAQSRQLLAGYAAALEKAWDRARSAAETLIDLNDSARAQENASAFLSGFGHVVVAWLWLDQAVAAMALPDDMFRKGKLHACRYFFEAELPKAAQHLAFVAALNDVAASMPEEAF